MSGIVTILTAKLILTSKHLKSLLMTKEPVNDSVEESDDRRAPSITEETKRKLLRGENILIAIDDDWIKCNNFES